MPPVSVKLPLLRILHNYYMDPLNVCLIFVRRETMVSRSPWTSASRIYFLTVPLQVSSWGASFGITFKLVTFRRPFLAASPKSTSDSDSLFLVGRTVPNSMDFSVAATQLVSVMDINILRFSQCFCLCFPDKWAVSIGNSASCYI